MARLTRHKRRVVQKHVQFYKTRAVLQTHVEFYTKKKHVEFKKETTLPVLHKHAEFKKHTQFLKSMSSFKKDVQF